MASYWLAWALARRGEFERPWELLREAKVESMTVRPFQNEIEAELLAITARWNEVPEFLTDSRTYAAEADLLALPVHLDRLEGRAALAAGDLERGLELLAAARDGFADLGAVWERARTELDLAEALAGAGREGDGRTFLEAATPDIERVGALIEIDRERSLRERLD